MGPGGDARLVFVDADAKGGLGGTRIGRVFAHERQNFVAGGLGEGLEHDEESFRWEGMVFIGGGKIFAIS